MSDIGVASTLAADAARRRRRTRLLSAAGCAVLVALALVSEIPQADTVLAGCCAALMLLVHRSADGVRRRAAAEPPSAPECGAHRGPSVDAGAQPRTCAAIPEDEDRREVAGEREQTLSLLQALASLRRREEQLAEAQRLARLGHWEWDLVTQEVAVSEEVWRVLGLPGAAVGTLERFMGYVHPEDQELISTLNRQALRTGEPYACDLRAIGGEGRELLIAVRARVQVDPAGVPLRLIGTLQDVTERWRATVALERRDAILEAISFAAERFLRTSAWDQGLKEALERIGYAAGASRAYLFERSSDAGGAILVCQREEWVASGIVPQIDNPELQNVRLADLGLGRWERMLQRNEHVQEIVAQLSAEERIHLADQDIQSILLIPISVGGEWWGFLGFDDCVTAREWSTAEREVLAAAAGMIGAAIERTRSEVALRESELRFKQLSDNIPEVFFMTKVDMSEVLYLSPSFERVWGRSLAEAHADPMIFVESILPEDRAALFEDMELSRSGKGTAQRHIDYRIRRPDGAIRWIRNRVFQIPDADGNPYRVAGVCTDVTAHKQMEEELRRANRIEAIGHLAAGIAHEINTPIQYIGDNLRFLDDSYADLRTAVDAFRSLLVEAAAGPVDASRLAEIEAEIRRADLDFLIEQAPRATAQAMDGIGRVAEIVRAMKEFSHPGTGEKVPTDLNQAIRSTTTVARNEWRYVAELVTHLDPALPPVHCLAGEVNQAILNLVVNAAHAIADRQSAEGTSTPGVIGISTAACGEHVEISVSDSGSGIPVAIRQRIFDPFFTTKEVGRGTGQGLTFVHSTVVDKHGGTITFESEPGVGTTFIIRLPLGSAVPGLEEAA
ncbi:MAG TPA: PAS domain-containing protein [Longimicrobiaceae bacterium]